NPRVNAGNSESGESDTMASFRKWMFPILLILIFITGVLGGIMLERVVLAPSVKKIAPLPAQRGRDEFIGVLKTELSLSDQQVADITAVLKAHEEKFREFRIQMRDKFEELDMTLFKNIESVMDEKQTKRFREIVRERRKGPRGPMPGGPVSPSVDSLDGVPPPDAESGTAPK
ncbi:MAG: hypothetical protein AB1742_05070, partial [bacterium]